MKSFSTVLLSLCYWFLISYANLFQKMDNPIISQGLSTVAKLMEEKANMSDVENYKLL